MTGYNPHTNGYTSFSQHSLGYADNHSRQPYDYIQEKAYAEKKAQSYSTPIVPRGSEDIAGHIFQKKLYTSRLGLNRLSDLLDERYELHDQHIKNIRRRHGQCYGTLSTLNRTLYPLSGKYHDKRLAELGKSLLELEADERRAELSFWKDSAELRSTIFDSLLEYNKAKDTSDLFGFSSN